MQHPFIAIVSGSRRDWSIVGGRGQFAAWDGSALVSLPSSLLWRNTVYNHLSVLFDHLVVADSTLLSANLSLSPPSHKHNLFPSQFRMRAWINISQYIPSLFAGRCSHSNKSKDWISKGSDWATGYFLVWNFPFPVSDGEGATRMCLLDTLSIFSTF